MVLSDVDTDAEFIIDGATTARTPSTIPYPTGQQLGFAVFVVRGDGMACYYGSDG